MQARRIRLRDFRSYERAEAELGEGLTVVLGPNGAGKTNLLEAVYFALTSRSCRTSNERELVRLGAELTRTEAEVAGEDGAHLLEVGFKPGEDNAGVRIHMSGNDVFKHAVRCMAEVSTAVLERNGLAAGDIDLIIPHQANIRIIEAIAKKLDVDMDKIYVNVDRIGNTSAASIPIALTEAVATGRIRPGMKVLLSSFGGGFTWASSLLQF